MTRFAVPSRAHPARALRRPRSYLAVWLATCIAGIIYSTLYPWAGWRAPAVSMLAFLSEPWPRYWTWQDLLLNIAGYVPLGLLGAAWLGRRLPVLAASLLALAGAALLSCSLEALQTLLPARVSSLTDLLANSAGACVGAALAAALGLQRIEAWPGALARALALAPGSASGVLLLALWIAVQWHPQPIALASGELAPLLAAVAPRSDAWLASLHLAARYQPLAEAVAVAATLLAVGLLARELLRTTTGWAISIPLVLAASAKSSATANLLGTPHALAWLSAGAQGGLLAGALLLTLTVWWQPRSRLLAAIAALICATLLANLSPPNVYFLSTMASWRQGGWVNLNGLLRALAIVWPFAAIGWCFLRLRRYGDRPIIA